LGSSRGFSAIDESEDRAAPAGRFEETEAEAADPGGEDPRERSRSPPPPSAVSASRAPTRYWPSPTPPRDGDPRPKHKPRPSSSVAPERFVAGDDGREPLDRRESRRGVASLSQPPPGYGHPGNSRARSELGLERRAAMREPSFVPSRMPGVAALLERSARSILEEQINHFGIE